MAFFYGILSILGWTWCATVFARVERDVVRASLPAFSRGRN
jgi:hypothetical protein